MHDAEVRHDGFLQKRRRVEILGDAPIDLRRSRLVEDAKPREHACRIVLGRIKGRHVDARNPRSAAQEAASAVRPPRLLPCDQSVTHFCNDLLAVAEHEEVEEVGDRLRIVYARAAADDEGLLVRALRRMEPQPCEVKHIERIRNEKFDYSESAQGYTPFQLKQSSRVRYHLPTGMWTAEDGSTTHLPFGVHQIYEEIVAPIVQNLMQENRVERLKIYNHIKDQKIDYLNKWHQDTDAFYRANRSESADVINLMQESLREYVAAYNTLVSYQRTEDSMVKTSGNLDSAVVDVVDNAAETLAAFELQSEEFRNTQTNFEDYMERLKDDINQTAERFGHIEYYDAKLRDGHSNQIAVATDEVRSLDERRKPLALVNPLFAKTSELPPEPKIEEITYEHINLNLPALAKNALAQLKDSTSQAASNENTNQ